MEAVTIFEERIKLRSIPLKLGTLVEDFAKGVLNHRDVGANADLTA